MSIEKVKLQVPEGSNGFVYLMLNDVNVATIYHLEQVEERASRIAEMLQLLGIHHSVRDIETCLKNKAAQLAARSLQSVSADIFE